MRWFPYPKKSPEASIFAGSGAVEMTVEIITNRTSFTLCSEAA